MVSWTRSLALAAALLAWMLAALPALAYQRAKSDHGAPAHVEEVPVRVRLGAPVPGLPDGGASAIRSAMRAWERPACTGLRFAELAAPSLSGDEGQPVYEIRYVACSWAHGASLAAHTSVKSDPRTGAILEAVIELNGAYRFTTGEPVPEGALDLESVVLHELGHLIGLEHSFHRRAVMRAGMKPRAPPERTLQEDDIAGLCAIYPAGRAAPARREDTIRPSLWSAALVSVAALGVVALGVLLSRRARSCLRAAAFPRRPRARSPRSSR